MSAAVEWQRRGSDWADGIFREHGIQLTLGGEPTYVPAEPEGAEWSYAAVGPTKLDYARRLAAELLRGVLRGGAVFFTPGKLYPGEVNPRWALRLVRRRDGKPLLRTRAGRAAAEIDGVKMLIEAIRQAIGVKTAWMRLADPRHPASKVWALPLDYENGHWESLPWTIERAGRKLTLADGPAGLRLPLHLLAAGIPRRALVAELRDGILYLFFPPLLQDPFTELLAAIDAALKGCRIGQFELQGYLPADVSQSWTVISLAADPGVLEINIPPCASWPEYEHWLSELASAAEKVGLRSWKKPAGEHEGGSGGGNHLVWGGPSIEANPFFSRPSWLAAILRYWQRHPALAYAFTGNYVGPSSQAPRPDESAKELFDLEMAYRHIEGLPEGDHRSLINETMRHLHTDVTGNTHRSEISFDKFWNPHLPGGALGLIEFRAVESFPRAQWMSAIMLLWTAIAALQAARPCRAGLLNLADELHDRFFLPTPLWNDIESIFADLEAAGCVLDPAIFREMWEWKFPCVLRHEQGDAWVEVRHAHEGWPLLCEMPLDGGATSRFVDTSMRRLEVRASPAFAESRVIWFQERPLPLRENGGREFLAGLRYRRTSLYPCMHPGILPHLPLRVMISEKGHRVAEAAFEMGMSQMTFAEAPPGGLPAAANPCLPLHEGGLTFDLRLD